MTNADFPTRHEDRSLPRWISASVAVGAAMLAMVGILTVSSGAAVRLDPVAANTTYSAKAMGRSGTLHAQRVIY